jgi:acetyltransferase-like isoleucine patch superfamily enzyme
MFIVKALFFQIRPLLINIWSFIKFYPIAIRHKCLFYFGLSYTCLGSLSLNSHVRIGKNVIIAIASKGNLSIGGFSLINQRAVVKVAYNSELVLADNFSLGMGSTILVKGHWSIGDSSNISSNCAIFSRENDLHGNLKIGNDSNIGDNTIIDVSDDVIIGDNVAIGPGCKIYTHDHDYRDLNLPAWKGKIKTGKVIIGNNSWIGANVVIMPGVKVGYHSVIAAGSVVNRNVPDCEVYGGVPAKLLKKIE